MMPRLLAILLILTANISALAQDSAPAVPGSIWVLNLDGAVGPATSDYLVRGINDASGARASLIIIQMDTPGGLDGAMRDIIEAILASPVPVVSYVSPQGARAASAGTYILYASHFAAMAPATNLGAATPVSIGPSPPSTPTATDPLKETGNTAPNADAGGTAMERKMVNDAAAYIRSLAELHGRNQEWAELAVREAASLSASEALEANVIDLIASSMEDLLKQLDGKEVNVAGKTVVLELDGSPLFEAKPDWRTELLATITNPSLVLILGMIGFYGIILEFYNPGSLVPGTVGIICLLLAGYSLQLLPVNYAGLALLLVGMGLMVAEAVSPSFGILGSGGLVAFMMGGIILFDSDLEAFQIGWPIMLALGLISAGFIIITVTLALRMRRKEVTTGVDTMTGHTGTVLNAFSEQGQVQVDGEIWQAQCNSPLQAGDQVVITAVSGLTLSVEKEPN